MSKFKVGDKVIRNRVGYGEAVKGGVYEVSEVSDKSFMSSYGINLKGHETISGKFTYEASSFELYIDEDMKEKSNTLDILTPLQAAEAMLNEDKLQVYDTDCNKWYTFSCGHRNITIEDLKHIKLKLKPKTMIINGVEVPAPLKTLAGRKSAFYIDLFRKVLAETLMPYDIKEELMWETKEDAQRVLDAMLIPFNELNKGENHD